MPPTARETIRIVERDGPVPRAHAWQPPPVPPSREAGHSDDPRASGQGSAGEDLEGYPAPSRLEMRVRRERP